MYRTFEDTNHEKRIELGLVSRRGYGDRIAPSALTPSEAKSGKEIARLAVGPDQRHIVRVVVDEVGEIRLLLPHELRKRLLFLPPHKSVLGLPAPPETKKSPRNRRKA